MDTSETYIKMCEKVEEIQVLLNKEEEGNYLYLKFISNRPDAPLRAYSCVGRTSHPKLYWLEKYGSGGTAKQWVSYYYERDSYIDYYGDKVVWLPRQDQLQEMVEEVKDKWHYVFRFDRFLREPYLPATHMSAYVWFINLPEIVETEKVASMEQLWLAFAMKEKYNKVWDGREWQNG